MSLRGRPKASFEAYRQTCTTHALALLDAQATDSSSYDAPSILYYLAKLMTAGVNIALKPTLTLQLLACLSQQMHSLKPRQLENSLWALAKMQQYGSLHLDCSQQKNIHNFVIEFVKKHRQTNKRYLSLSLWSIAILLHDSPLPESLQEHIEKLFLTISRMKMSLIEKRQYVIAKGLLNLTFSEPSLAKHYQRLLMEVRPISKLKEHHVLKLIGTDTPYCLEENICGFFVDIYLPSEHKIIEVDGVSHQTQKQKMLDDFRDRVLKKKGYSILRVSAKEFYKKRPELRTQGLKTHGFFAVQDSEISVKPTYSLVVTRGKTT